MVFVFCDLNFQQVSTKTAILILAAGASQRLGTPKQLLHWKGTTLLEHTIKEVLTTSIGEVFVVLGAHIDDIQQQIYSYPITIIENKNWQEGMGTSIACGIQQLQAFDQVLITLCDLPLIDQGHYQKLLQEHSQTSKGITTTVFETIIGVPAVFDRSYFKTLSKLSGDRGARALIQKEIADVQVVKADVPFTDIDTIEDYRKLIRLTDA